ncbi:Alg9-like mannosyltransferase family-domain-containing protein [Sparassis latifolia]
MSAVLDLLIVATSWAHVFLAPYTKVEESFSLHATHDVLMYGVRPDVLPKYDHFIFPGAVPRTFIGSVLLAWLSNAPIRLACSLELVRDKFDLQIIVRLVLATINAIGFCLLRRTVSRRFGGLTSVLFAFLTCTQFHLPFWMGRTLPNMFAVFPVNVALSYLVNRAPNSTRPSRYSIHWAIALLTFTAVVFRSEVVLLLGPLVLQAVVRRYTTLTNIIKIGLIAGLSSVALTSAVDSYFWQQWPLWPELYGVYFNVVQGKSSEWGVLPFHTYFTSFLPKLLLSALPLSFVGALSDSRVRALLVPAVAYLVLISGLGHKEWRFIVYIVPLFNIAAARGGAWLTSRRKSSLFGRLCFLAVSGLLVCNCVTTYLLAMASIANYPGGEVLSKFNELYASHENVHVHISNLAAQTGASLFLQTHMPPYLHCLPHSQQHWTYNKTEHLSPEALTFTPAVTHVIAEFDGSTASKHYPAGFSANKWHATGTVDSFDRWKFNPDLKDSLRMRDVGALLRPLEMVRSKKLVILERNIWTDAVQAT